MVVMNSVRQEQRPIELTGLHKLRFLNPSKLQTSPSLHHTCTRAPQGNDEQISETSPKYLTSRLISL